MPTTKTGQGSSMASDLTYEAFISIMVLNGQKRIEAGWQYTVLTHITHSTDTKDTFQDIYPNGSIIKGPVDGWYSATASRFRLGFLAGRKLSAHLDFQLRLGCIISVQKQGIIMGFAHGQVPFYLNTQLNYRL